MTPPPSNPTHCAFALLERHANEAATGNNSRPHPTEAQAAAGNYKMGRVRVQGLDIRVENVRGSVRSGTSPDGKTWSNRMAAHYGYIAGTRGADGDEVDVFVGPLPESESVWVINQRDAKGSFDEHKVMVGFATEDQARSAYLHSYDRNWRGLQSIVPASLTQLKWWLRNGNKARAISPDQLPHEGESTMDQVRWSSAADPLNTTLPRVLYDMRRDDSGGLLLDACTIDDLMTDPDIEGRAVMDAMVVEVGMLQRKMEQLSAVMKASAAAVQPTDFTIADPVKMRGTMQIAVVFAMDDGQAVTVWFHNPDTTPNKLTPMDELVSWKWMLNKKDVTIVVAPERGRDLNAREVARRIMKLVEKNTEAFKRANARSAELAAQHAAIDAEIPVLEAQVAKLQDEVAVIRIAKGDGEIAPVPSASGVDANAAEMRAAIEKHGLPAETEFSPGKGAMGSSKWIAKAQGNQGNLAASIDEAAASLALFLKHAADGAEHAQQRDALAKAVAEKLKKGEQPTDVELRDLFGLQPQHTYVEQPVVGQFLVDYMGVSRSAIRTSLGAAAGFRVSDGGAKYPIVYPRKLHEVFGGAGVPAVAQPTPPVAGSVEQSLAALAQDLAAVFLAEGYFEYVGRQSEESVRRNLSTDALLDLSKMVKAIVGPDAYELGVAKHDPTLAGRKAYSRSEPPTPPAGLDDDQRAEWLAGWDDEKDIKTPDPVEPKPAVGEVVGEAAEVQDEPVADLSGDELGQFPDTPEGLNDLRNAAFKYLMDDLRTPEGFFCPALQANVFVQREGAKKIKSLGADQRKLRIVKAIPQIIEHGKRYRPSSPSYAGEPGVVAYHYLRCVIRLAGDPIAVRTVVKEKQDGSMLWDNTVHPVDVIFDSAKENGSTEVDPHPVTNYKPGAPADADQVAGDRPYVPPQQGFILDDAGSIVNTRLAVNIFIEGEDPEFVQEDETATAAEVVDGAYRFAQATERFKEYVAETVADPDYSMFATAKGIDEAAKARGASVSWDVEDVGVMDSVNAALDSVSYSVKVVFNEETPVNMRQFGAKQACFVDWGIYGGVALVEATTEDRAEFGGGTFRIGKGQTQNESIVRVDPKGMRLYFLDNQRYADTMEVKWDTPVSIKRLIVQNKEKFEAAYRAPVLDGVALDKAGADSKRAVVGRIFRDGLAVGVATVAGDGKAMIYVGGLGGDRVKDPNGLPAPRGSDPEYLVKWLLEPTAGPAPEPEPTPAIEDGNIAVLRSILAGESDSAHLSLTLATIEACVNALNDSGLLTGDVEQLAQDVITYWATLDEKVNG